jgi:3'-5' exoribonuclease
VLQHIILAHHGTAEFGSPRLPATPEALAVHAIENLDAKLMMSLTATRGEAATSAATEGNWTEYMKAFSTRMYRPDVAPADAQDNGPLEEPQATPPMANAAKTNSVATNPVTTNKMTITNPLFESTPAKKK